MNHKKIGLLFIILIGIAGYPSLNATQIIQIGVTSTSTEGLETLVPLFDIIEDDIDEYVTSQGYNYDFNFVIKDNQGSEYTALANTQAFKAMGVDLILGHGWSGQCSASLSYVNANNMLLLSSSSTSPLLSIPGDRLFRVSMDDFNQVPAIAQMWKTWGVKAVLVMHRGDAWGDGIYNLLQDEFAEAGIELLGHIRYSPESTQFSSYLSLANTILGNAIDEHGVDKVGFQYLSFSESRTFLSEAADYPNLMNVIWMSTESGGRSERMIDECGDLVILTRHFSALQTVVESDPKWLDFEEEYYERTGYMPSWWTAAQYDSAWLLVKCILETGSTDASIIAEALIPYSTTYNGLTGNMALGETGDRLPQLFDIWGYYYDFEYGEPWFRKFGIYDGRSIDVIWDDVSLLDVGLIRPGYSSEPIDTTISCYASQNSMHITDNIMYSGSILPAVSSATVEVRIRNPRGEILSRYVDADSFGQFSYLFTPDESGIWSVTTSWDGNEYFNGASSNTIQFIVTKMPSELSCQVFKGSLVIDDFQHISGSLSPSLLNANISVVYTKPDVTSISRVINTNEAGALADSLQPDLAGIWTVSVEWQGNENYTSSNSFSTFKILKKSSEVSVDSSTDIVDMDEPISFTGLIDADVTDSSVILIFIEPDGSTFNETVVTEGGSYSESFIFSQTGIWSVQAVWEGNPMYNGSTSSMKAFSVNPVQHLKILVKDEDGRIIDGAEVTSTSQPGRQTTLTGVTGSDGAILFEKVQTGSYTLLAVAEGYESNSDTVVAQSETTAEKTILLEKKPSGIPGFPIQSILLAILTSAILMRARATPGQQPEGFG